MFQQVLVNQHLVYTLMVIPEMLVNMVVVFLLVVEIHLVLLLLLQHDK